MALRLGRAWPLGDKWVSYVERRMWYVVLQALGRGFSSSGFDLDESSLSNYE